MGRFKIYGLKLVLIALLMGFVPVHAMAEDCASTNPSTCAYVPKKQTAVVVPTKNPVYDPVCQQVTNNCSFDIMVPTFNQTEWSSFVTKHESCAVLAVCPTISIALTASPANVNVGGSSTLSWVITGNVGAVTCTATSTDTPSTWSQTYSYATVPAGPAGTAVVTPVPPAGSASTTYSLACTDSIKNTGYGSVTLGVNTPLACAPGP